MDEPLHIGRFAVIPLHELTFTFSHSGGPGGQNVNKVATKATLWFAVDASGSLTDQQKRLIHRNLAPRINKEGLLYITSQEHRSQSQNRDATVERLVELMVAALTPRPRRKRTRIPRAQRAQRLENKIRRSKVKRMRKPPDTSEL